MILVAKENLMKNYPKVVMVHSHHLNFVTILVMIISIQKIVVLVEEPIIKEEVIAAIRHMVIDLTQEEVVILEEVYILNDQLYVLNY